MDKNIFKRLVLILLLITGIFFLYMGYREFFADIVSTKNYETTNGYFMKYDMDASSKPVTYTLTYSYVVDRQTYFMNAKNKVTKLPALGSQKIIKYQKKNPKTSVVIELNGGEKYIITGLIFLLIATFGLVNRFLNRDKESEHSFYKVAGIISGLLLVAIGCVIYYFYGIGVDSTGILDIWNSIKWMLIIPFIPFLAGFIIIITTIFFDRDEMGS